jgi:hypothetical protein
MRQIKKLLATLGLALVLSPQARAITYGPWYAYDNYNRQMRAIADVEVPGNNQYFRAYGTLIDTCPNVQFASRHWATGMALSDCAPAPPLHDRWLRLELRSGGPPGYLLPRRDSRVEHAVRDRAGFDLLHAESHQRLLLLQRLWEPLLLHGGRGYPGQRQLPVPLDLHPGSELLGVRGVSLLVP